MRRQEVAAPVTSNGATALDVAIAAAREAGALARRRFYEAKEVSLKGARDLVTDVDLAVERGLRETLSRAFPGIGVQGEELGAAGAGQERWIVDPIDGTRNYAAGIPHFCVNIALARDDAVLVGVTYDPMRDELFTSALGQGTFLNGRPIGVSKKRSVAECILSFDISSMNPKALQAFALVRGLWPGMQSVRIMGSSALGLAYAACGRVDLYFHHSLWPWDVASGLLLVREAGGEVVERGTGKPAGLSPKGVLASSKPLLEEFLALTKDEAWHRTE
ncbi:MAG: inositol monophosphatase [Chloroflexi bacterium]|nr:inositol monophosphatase [Chloroflexota bacterium]